MAKWSVFALIALGLAAMPFDSAIAQDPLWSSLARGSDQSEYDVLHPLIQSVLIGDPVGAKRAWHSASGVDGFVELVSRGDRSGAAVVAITTVHHGHERLLDTFRYRRQADGHWRLIG